MKPHGGLKPWLRSVLLGTSLPAAVDLPLLAPQREVTVWLHGLGAPRDVTECHAVACASPCILCITTNKNDHELFDRNRPLSLRFVERRGRKRLLGEIRLRALKVIAAQRPLLALYKATACTNHCVPPIYRWLRLLESARQRWKHRASGGMKLGPVEQRCNEVLFCCPRPAVLASTGSTIFPMNLMGNMGSEYFVFALGTGKRSELAVLAAHQLAVCYVPFEQAEIVRKMGKYHHDSSVAWGGLPFSTRPSEKLAIPIPCFATSVTEMALESAHPLGSHTFFVARVLDRQSYLSKPLFYRIHGCFAALRPECLRELQSDDIQQTAP